MFDKDGGCQQTQERGAKAVRPSVESEQQSAAKNKNNAGENAKIQRSATQQRQPPQQMHALGIAS